MSRSFKRYPICKQRCGDKVFKKFANKHIRHSKEIKNKGHYKKFYYIDKYPRHKLAQTLENYTNIYCDIYLLDEIYKNWITQHYTK